MRVDRPIRRGLEVINGCSVLRGAWAIVPNAPLLSEEKQQTWHEVTQVVVHPTNLCCNHHCS
jgi:hypothetical protein